MARVRADPVTTALAHPTRRALYIALSNKEEMSTVHIQSEVSVERYWDVAGHKVARGKF